MSGELNPDPFGRLKEYLKRAGEPLWVLILGSHYRGICPVSNKGFRPLDTYISTPSKQTHKVYCPDCGREI
jgi:hypothetical protein